MRFIYQRLHEVNTSQRLASPEEPASASMCRPGDGGLSTAQFQTLFCLFQPGTPASSSFRELWLKQMHIEVLVCWSCSLSFPLPMKIRYPQASVSHLRLLKQRGTFPLCFLCSLCRSPAAFCPLLFLPSVLVLWAAAAPALLAAEVRKKSPFLCQETGVNGLGRRDENRCNTNCHFAK